MYDRAFRKFRAAGRPSDKQHPDQVARDAARAELRRVRRLETKQEAEKNHNDLMMTHSGNFSGS